MTATLEPSEPATNPPVIEGWVILKDIDGLLTPNGTVVHRFVLDEPYIYFNKMDALEIRKGRDVVGIRIEGESVREIVAPGGQIML